MTEELKIISEGTPNPNALKFVLNKTLIEGRSANFDSKDKAHNSPLARKLFDINAIEEIFIGKNFITVTKHESALWESLYNQVIDTITSHFESGEPVFASMMEESTASSGDPIVDKIKEFLDTRVRPAVESDGGDIIFSGFENGIVKLRLQGACSSCPSSTITLKHGIEQMLRREIPEVKEVIAI